jgi:hypothetical protein
MSLYRYIALGLALFALSFTTIAQQLRDPTRPQAGIRDKVPTAKTKKSNPSPKLVLQTILIGDDRRAAVINGRLIAVGDTISGYRLSEIRAGEVVLLKGKGNSRTLYLFPDVHLSDAKIAMPSELQKGQR